MDSDPYPQEHSGTHHVFERPVPHLGCGNWVFGGRCRGYSFRRNYNLLLVGGVRYFDCVGRRRNSFASASGVFFRTTTKMTPFNGFEPGSIFPGQAQRQTHFGRHVKFSLSATTALPSPMLHLPSQAERRIPQAWVVLRNPDPGAMRQILRRHRAPRGRPPVREWSRGDAQFWNGGKSSYHRMCRKIG